MWPLNSLRSSIWNSKTSFNILILTSSFGDVLCFDTYRKGSNPHFGVFGLLPKSTHGCWSIQVPRTKRVTNKVKMMLSCLRNLHAILYYNLISFKGRILVKMFHKLMKFSWYSSIFSFIFSSVWMRHVKNSSTSIFC